MDINTIGKNIYKGSDLRKKEQMDAIYYKMADFLKEHNPEWYKKFHDEAEDVAYEIDAEEAKRIVAAMKPHGQHWSMGEVENYLKTRGINEKIKSFYLAMNMAYNDYSRTAKQHNLDVPEFYFDIAFDFINDIDAGRHKVAKYFALK